MNMTLFNEVICMLAFFGLPVLFWGEIGMDFAWLINVYPSFQLDFKVLDQVWSGKRPNYSRLRVFNCAAYAHESERKLEPRSI